MNWQQRRWILTSTIVATLLSSVYVYAAESVATITEIHRTVFYRVSYRSGEDLAKKEMPVFPGYVIRTPPLSRVTITYHDNSKSTITLSGQSLLRVHVKIAEVIETLGISASVAQALPTELLNREANCLTSGKGQFEAAEDFIGCIPGALLKASATGRNRFIASVLSDESTHISVLEGSVDLSAPALGSGVNPNNLNETVSFGAQASGTIGVKTITVSAGQGAIMRPGEPLKAAFSIDTNQVKLQEGVVMPTSTLVSTVTPTTTLATPTLTQGTVNTQPLSTTSSPTQLQNVRVEPKDLGGSSILGNIRVIIK